LPADLPAAQLDPEQMSIVLRNLLRNASDAMPQGGTLTITGRATDNTLWLDVTDTGSGIAPEDIARVMEPLFTTKARGIGLGLAMARSITEKNNGDLSVISELGRGTTFTIELPVAVSRC
jgi:signal transduction histidine kinase